MQRIQGGLFTQAAEQTAARGPTSGAGHEAQDEGLLRPRHLVGRLEHLLGRIHLVSLQGGRHNTDTEVSSRQEGESRTSFDYLHELEC